MPTTEVATTGSAAANPTDYDVVIIGAGVSGIHQLHALKDSGLSVRVLEAGSGIGGTWFWNRYPLARFDSESYSYGYFFSEELLEEWEWSEHFAGQPEIERYLNFVVDKFDLRGHFQFDTRVEAAIFDDRTNTWTLRTSHGASTTARFVVAATGLLSAPFIPDIPGKNAFLGASYHTGLWPHDPVDFTGKRVAMIGTGASGVQLLPAIAPEVASITVYQRTPNWCGPLNNAPITPEEQADIKASYAEIERLVRSSIAGFIHPDGTKASTEDSKEQRHAFYEELWSKRGMAKLFGNYSDLMTNPEVNAEFSAFAADKIRRRVSDPETAAKLIPTDHGYGMKRPPFETGYYETYNRPNVSLVDLKEAPILRITETGIVTTDGEQQFDIIIWATGFDAITGSLTRMGIVGSGGTPLVDAWADGPTSYLGIATRGFPNLFFINGPHFPASNAPRSTDIQVEFITTLVEHLAEHGYVRAEPTEDAESIWADHVLECAAPLLVAQSNYVLGTNIPGKPNRYLAYVGGLGNYKARLDDVAENAYDGFVLGKESDSPALSAAS